MLRSISLFFLFISITFYSLSISADDRIYGVWIEDTSGQRIDILDGFKPGQGAVLSVNKKGKVKIGKWERRSLEVVRLKIGSSEESIKFKSNNSFYWGKKSFTRQARSDEQITTLNLKEGTNAFVEKLTKFQWLTSIKSRVAVFKTTFSGDSGAVELYKSNKFLGLDAWGISSGVLKIGDIVIVEARISDQNFIGLNGSGEFIVFRSLKKSPPRLATNVKLDRVKFFNSLLTDEWVTGSYWKEYLYTHKFRPIYGDLKGVTLTFRGGKHYDDGTWEYIPATGILKFGYTEYVDALIVNNTLALKKKDGSQKFYNRAPDGKGKRFTLADVTKIPLNENELDKINKTLTGQFQNDDYLYQFEYNKNLRTGFLHKWRSRSFEITGDKFKTGAFYNSETLYLIEDFIIFDDNEVFKRDTSASRLRPKTEEEVIVSQKEAEKNLLNAMKKTVLVRISKADGSTVDVPLPISSFSDILSLQIVRE